MPGTCKLRQTSLAEANLLHARIVVRDISGSPPRVGADVSAPSPHRIVAILAEAVKHWPSALQERIMHLGVRVGHNFVRGFGARRCLHLRAQPAKVVFEIVEAPLRVCRGILLFVSEAAFIARACFGSWRGIDAKLQTFAMD